MIKLLDVEIELISSQSFSYILNVTFSHCIHAHRIQSRNWRKMRFLIPAINNFHRFIITQYVINTINPVFYHDVDEIFWPQPTRSHKLGHVTGQGSMSPTWVGRVSDPGKNGSHKKYKNLDDIAVYLLASLKSKWKNKQIKNMNNWKW